MEFLNEILVTGIYLHMMRSFQVQSSLEYVTHHEMSICKKFENPGQDLGVHY